MNNTPLHPIHTGLIELSNLSNLTSIDDLIKRYDAFLIDLWGVVHDGENPYVGVIDALNEMIARRKTVMFFSNAPRPGTVLIKKLQDFGIRTTPEMILSSGEVVSHHLTNFEEPHFKNSGRSIYHLGANRNKDIAQSIMIRWVEDLEVADFVLLTAYLDADEDLNQYDAFLKKAYELNKPFLCANPDKIIMQGDSRRYCAGYLAEKYENMGGQVYYYGKPHPGIYKMAVSHLYEKHGILNKNQIVCIGDTLETDIAGANAFGIDSALVMTGNIAKLLENDERALPAGKLIPILLKEYNLMPTWIIRDFQLGTGTRSGS